MNPSAKAAGLQLGTCACRDRPHDGGPAAYVERSVGIGVGNVSTTLTDKLTLRAAVGLLAVPALVAGLRGVGRIDAHERYPGKPGFVFEEAAKLPEGPLAVPTTLRSPEPLAGAFPDAFEIFEGYAPVGLLRLAYDALAEYVVRIAFEPTLFAGQLLQVPLCGLRARRLQLRADALVALARLLNALGCVDLAVRIGGDVSHPRSTPSQSSGVPGGGSSTSTLASRYHLPLR